MCSHMDVKEGPENYTGRRHTFDLISPVFLTLLCTSFFNLCFLQRPPCGVEASVIVGALNSVICRVGSLQARAGPGAKNAISTSQGQVGIRPQHGGEQQATPRLNRRRAVANKATRDRRDMVSVERRLGGRERWRLSFDGRSVA
jgi:hypothetical protein